MYILLFFAAASSINFLRNAEGSLAAPAVKYIASDLSNSLWKLVEICFPDVPPPSIVIKSEPSAPNPSRVTSATD